MIISVGGEGPGDETACNDGSFLVWQAFSFPPTKKTRSVLSPRFYGQNLGGYPLHQDGCAAMVVDILAVCKCLSAGE